MDSGREIITIKMKVSDRLDRIDKAIDKAPGFVLWWTVLKDKRHVLWRFLEIG